MCTILLAKIPLGQFRRLRVSYGVSAVSRRRGPSHGKRNLATDRNRLREDGVFIDLEDFMCPVRRSGQGEEECREDV